MDFQTIASAMWPCWVFGAGMLYATKKSDHADLLKVDKKALSKWGIFLLLLTVWRIFSFKFYAHSEHFKDSLKAVDQIPWQATLTVFWEDACHGLPLVLLQRLIGTKKWFTKPINYIALLVTMVAFGLGHLYQGVFSAVLLSFYIPYSMKLGKKYGFGTVMLGHMMYDLSTILAIKWMMGHV